jgi:cytochrome c biogenesis protein CcdA
MSDQRENAAIIGVGAAVCAVCCAGPILGVVAAIGLGTAAGFALFGTIAVVVGAAVIAFVFARRRRGAVACDPADASSPVPVELTEARSRS